MKESLSNGLKLAMTRTLRTLKYETQLKLILILPKSFYRFESKSLLRVGVTQIFFEKAGFLKIWQIYF